MSGACSSARVAGITRMLSTPAPLPVVRPLSVWGLAAAVLKIECGSTAKDFGRDAYRSERTQRDARLAGADYYYAVFQVAGRSTLTQNEEVAQLAVGDVALLDAAHPAACSAGDAQWLRVQLPRISAPVTCR